MVAASACACWRCLSSCSACHCAHEPSINPIANAAAHGAVRMAQPPLAGALMQSLAQAVVNSEDLRSPRGGRCAFAAGGHNPTRRAARGMGGEPCPICSIGLARAANYFVGEFAGTGRSDSILQPSFAASSALGATCSGVQCVLGEQPQVLRCPPSLRSDRQDRDSLGLPAFRKCGRNDGDHGCSASKEANPLGA